MEKINEREFIESAVKFYFTNEPHMIQFYKGHPFEGVCMLIEKLKVILQTVENKGPGELLLLMAKETLPVALKVKEDLRKEKGGD